MPEYHRVTLKHIDIKKLKKPAEVEVPLTGYGSQFVGPDNWRENIVACIESNMMQSDDLMNRIPPMAFVRCSRGGKTRSLLEVVSMLKARSPQVAAIYLSFNNDTEIDDNEKDAVAALRRRIAYYSLKEVGSGNDFEKYREMEFSESDLLEWLGDQPCVLFVDELNLLGDRMDRKSAAFVKSRFLKTSGRYFVFSSHIASTPRELSAYMESVSNRSVLAPELPLIPSLRVAAEKLKLPDLNPREAIYYGTIPGLIYEAKTRAAPYQKRGEVIAFCKYQNLVSDHSIKVLLASFITGEFLNIPPPLLQLMDTWSEAGESLKVKWIPFHMMEVLRLFATFGSIDRNTVLVLKSIEYLFSNFKRAKEYSGDGWEALFVITLLIRSKAECFGTSLLPLEMVDFDVTFNEPLKDNVSFWDIKQVDEFIEALVEPETFPHIAIYWPRDTQLEHYDVIVAVYAAKGFRKLYGYQLREGKRIVKAQVSHLFAKSFVVWGNATENSSQIRGWYVASTNEIREFFGESGRNWTPMRWKALK